MTTTVCASWEAPRTGAPGADAGGDNDILREMKRGYTHERYRRIIDTIRHYDPEAAVSGDAIVGFPGETEEQFQRTMHLVQEIGFDVVNTAAYSPRPFTEAAVWEDQ
ncbi:hypothetical protein CYMTET_35486, partial [Cymbomonas tetramitiformis]